MRVTGQIGPLRMGSTDRAAVVAFAGKPDATTTGTAPGAYAPYLFFDRTIGCTAALHFDSPTGSLSIDFAGGVSHGTSIKGAHVDAFVVHGKRRDAGVFDCL